jgi:putative endonuclease
MRPCWTYILTNRHRTVLYVGMTNNLVRRCLEHRHPDRKCFTARYQVRHLVHYEWFPRPMRAIEREKQLKAGPRAAKVRLIERGNPAWLDLFDEERRVVLELPVSG